MKYSIQKYIFSAFAVFAIISCGKPTASISDIKFALSNNNQIIENQLFDNEIVSTQIDSFVIVPQITSVIQSQIETESQTQPVGTFYLPSNSQFQYIANGANNDMAFDFYLPDNLTENDSILLHYQLNGVADYTNLFKKINNSEVVGGQFVKTDTVWREQTEELPYFSFKKGKNTIRYQLPKDLEYGVAIKDIQLQIIPKANKNSGYVVVNQPNNHSYYNTFGYLQGYVDDDNAKLTIDNKEVKTKNGFFELIVNKNANNQNSDVWTSKIKVEYANGNFVERDATFKNSIDYDFATGGKYIAQSVKQDISPKNDFEISLLGAKLSGNKNSVLEDRTLSITALRSIDMAVVSSNMINVTAEAAGYRFLPKGQKFENQQVIAIKYDTALLTQGYTPNDIFTFYYDENSRQWQRIQRDSIDFENCIIYSYTDHFTDYINSILKAPETPEVSAYTPTMMKDLQAAHPHTGIGQFSVPEANNKGTANTSMPLWIPAGRNGMQPNLNLTYNSGGGNGWLGQGWDIPFSSIEVETRWGVPLYSNTKETETYLLDGETLALDTVNNVGKLILKKPTYRRDFEPRINDSVRFYRRVEGAFQKIMRYGNSPKNYYFVVTNKDGSKMTYGNVLDSELKDGNGITGNIGKWYLTKIEDLNGNFVEFKYKRRTHFGGQGQKIYIDEIRYTGHAPTSENGRYKVKFNVAKKPNNTDFIRTDITTNARKGLLETEAWLLDRVDVLYDTDTLRQYYFGYKEGAYGKTLLCNMLDADSLFKTSANIAIFTRQNVFNRNADYDNIGAGDYYPIKYYFDYNLQDSLEFEPTETPITNQNDNYNYGSAFPMWMFGGNNYNLSGLGGGVSFSGGGGASANFGFGPAAWFRTFSFGGHFDLNYSEQYSVLTLVDLNGDGYADKLFRHNITGELSYRLFDPETKKFGALKDINGINKFNYSNTWTPSFGVNVNMQVGGKKVGVGAAVNLNFAFPVTNTSKYYADIDGDGLPDFIDNDRNGKIWLNRINASTPHFTSDYGQSDTIWVGGSCGDEYVLNDVAVDQRVFYKTTYDTIWYDGQYNIDLCNIFTPYGDIENNEKKYYKYYIQNCDICNNTEWTEDDTLYDMIRFHCTHDTVRREFIDDSLFLCCSYEVITTQTCIIEPIYQPNIEAIRCWIAPATGVVNISGVAALSDGDLDGKSMAELREQYEVQDGIMASIQHSYGPITSSTSKRLKRGIATPSQDAYMAVNSLSVSEGDRLYFRIESLERRTLDVVDWNPVIEYVGIDADYHFAGAEEECLQSKDNNGRYNYKFDSKNDFIANSDKVQIIHLPVRGNLHKKINVKIDNVSEDVNLLMVYCNNTINMQTWNFPANQMHDEIISLDTYITNYNYNLMESADKDDEAATVRPDSICFVMYCDGEVDWSKVFVDVDMHYTTSENDGISVVEIVGDKTIYTFDYKPYVYKRAVQYTKQRALPFTYVNGEVVLMYASNSDIRVKIYNITTDSYHILQLSNPQIHLHSLNEYYIFTSGHQYLIDIYDDDENPPMGYTHEGGLAIFQNGNQVASRLWCGVHFTAYHQRSKWGHFHRNWTQFGYKPPITGDFIKEKLLNSNHIEQDPMLLDEANIPNEITINELNPEAPIGGAINPLTGAFFRMTPDYKNNRYIGYGNTIYVTEDVMSNFNTEGNEEYIAAESLPVAYVDRTAGEKPKTVKKRLTGFDFSVGLNLSLVLPVDDELLKDSEDTSNPLGAGLAWNWGSTNLNADYMDLNGDRYPDIVTESGVQYSKPQGGLSADKFLTFEKNQDFVYQSKSKGNVANANIGMPVIENKIDNNVKNNKLISTTTAGFSGSEAADFATRSWVDINGDGLPDKIDLKNSDDKVYYNIGYNFLTSTFARAGDKIRETKTKSNSVSLGTGVNFDVNKSISGGVSKGSANNYTLLELMDVNGDGLPDKVFVKNNNLYVQYNYGSGFMSEEKLLYSQNNISKGTTDTRGINGAFTVGGSAGVFKFTVTPAINFGWSISQDEVVFTDFNNDGFPDIVRSNPNSTRGDLIVRYAIPKPVNMLTKIVSPTNLEINIDYKMSGHSSVDNPYRNWEMTECLVGFSCHSKDVNKQKRTFEYENRKYNRFERDDYGYEKVITKLYNIQDIQPLIIQQHINMPVVRIIEDIYDQNNYLSKGLKLSTTLKNANDEVFQERTYTYYPKEIESGVLITAENAHCLGGAWMALSIETTTFIEGSSISAKTEYTHGSYGNVNGFSQFSNVNNNPDVYSFNDIIFHEDISKYIVGIVDEINYKAEGSPHTYSKKSEIDQNGNITKLTYNGLQEIDLEYDSYGNIILKRFPEDGNNNRKEISYEYDDEIFSLPVEVTDIFGYTSSVDDYDFRWQVPKQTTDIGGSIMKYKYDTRGRIKSIKTPKDPDYTVKYEYWNNMPNFQFYNLHTVPCDSKFEQWVTTSHYNADNPTQPINLKVVSDGFGNILYTKKDIFLYGLAYIPVYFGYTFYDCLGQPTIQVANPISGNSASYLDRDNYRWVQQISSDNTSDKCFIKQQYDNFGRKVKTILQDNTEINTEYAIEDVNGENLFKTSVTDALNNTSHVWKDTRGLQYQMQSPLGAETQFQYDGIGQLLKTIDPETHETTFEYDILGRTEFIDHPSRGLTTWTYNGTTSQPSTENNQLGDIRYTYDILGRPQSVEYSEYPMNNVYYEYGDLNAGLNAGKLIKMQDATGVSEFEYGDMGEVTAQTRMHILPNHFWLTHRTEWEYDSWGKTKKIIYPDGEEVDYFYNNVGNLQRVTSNQNGDYIEDILYNALEQKTQIDYGNGTRHEYSYNPVMQRLTNSTLLDNQGNPLFEKSYKYDEIGNIRDLNDNLTAAGENLQHSYNYDEDNRLTSASANSSGTSHYKLYMDYSPAGRILHKDLNGTGLDNSGNFNIHFVNDYHYNRNNNPYAVSNLSGTYSESLYWDNAGNLCYKKSSDENFYWTEDNRMQAYRGKDRIAHYRYDAGGERDLKLVGNLHDAYVMGSWYRIPTFTDATLYASPLMTVNSNGYVKHYFAESERILSNIGGGTNGNAMINPREELKILKNFSDVKDFSERFTIFAAEYLAEANNNPNRCENNGIGYPAEMEQVSHLHEIFEQEVQRGNQDVSYYYHSDHLSGASMITNSSGQFHQALAYTPFGEDLINVTAGGSGSYETEHRFTGYHRDQESGLDYAHARYYNPDISIFISPDAKWYLSPHESSYVYSGNNPIMYIDPDGNQKVLSAISKTTKGVGAVGAYFFAANLMQHYGWNSDIRQAGYGMQHPINAVRVGWVVEAGSNNITTIASNFEVNIAKPEAAGLTRGEGSQGNAYRHALWQAIITNEMGANHAQQIGNAHETHTGGTNQRLFETSGGVSAMTQADRVVDLLNNVIGRQIGEKNKGASNQTMAKAVAKEFYEKGLWTASENKNGTVSIQKTRITKAQYDAAIREINKKGENGLNK